MPVRAEQLPAITTEPIECHVFKETLRILTSENSTKSASRIPAPTFSNVEKDLIISPFMKFLTFL